MLPFTRSGAIPFTCWIPWQPSVLDPILGNSAAGDPLSPAVKGPAVNSHPWVITPLEGEGIRDKEFPRRSNAVKGTLSVWVG